MPSLFSSFVFVNVGVFVAAVAVGDVVVVVGELIVFVFVAVSVIAVVGCVVYSASTCSIACGGESFVVITVCFRFQCFCCDSTVHLATSGHISTLLKDCF